MPRWVRIRIRRWRDDLVRIHCLDERRDDRNRALIVVLGERRVDHRVGPGLGTCQQV
jgi:hypothetical protein